MSTNSLTVVIPYFNNESTIKRAVESVLSSNISLEILIVDDGSSQALVISDFIDTYEYPFINVIRQDNSGLGSARLNGAVSASTKYISFLDADDEVTPDRFSRQFNLAEQHDGSFPVYCGSNIYDEFGYFIKDRLASGGVADITRNFITGRNVPSGASLFIKRDLFINLHFGLPVLRRSSEALFVMRMLSYGLKIYCINKPLYIQHVSPISNSRQTTFRLDSIATLYGEASKEISSSNNATHIVKYINWKIRSQIKSSGSWGVKYRFTLLLNILKFRHLTLMTLFFCFLLLISIIFPIKFSR